MYTSVVAHKLLRLGPAHRVRYATKRTQQAPAYKKKSKPSRGREQQLGGLREKEKKQVFDVYFKLYTCAN